MDVKEAIELLVDEKYIGEGIIELPFYQKEQNKRFDDIIALFQQGEKYRQMWEELHDIASEYNFFPLMDKLEEKYFPKGAE